MIKQKILNYLLKWQGVPQEHELIDKLSSAQLIQFSQEAQAIKQFGYFKWFVEDMELLAERKMFNGDKELQLFGKGILYALEIMKSNVSKMANGVKADSPEKKKMTRFI